MPKDKPGWGGARPKRSPDDDRGGRRISTRPDAKKAGRTPNIVAAAELVAARLTHHAHRFSDDDLNRIGAALRSATGSVEAEFTRRMDEEDTGEE